MAEGKDLSRESGLSKAQQLDAINWAANKAGLSYGVYSVSLRESDKERIYEDYARLLAQEREKEKLWLAAKEKT